MKTSLKKLFIPLLSGLIACNFYSCDSDNEHTAIPIAPILKEIKFPSENDITPGQVAQINGLGFAKEDVLYLNDETNKKEKADCQAAKAGKTKAEKEERAKNIETENIFRHRDSCSGIGLSCSCIAWKTER